MRPTHEKQRLHETFQDDRRYLTQMLALGKNVRSDRVDAILELKTSLDTSSARLQAQNATLHRRAQELVDSEKRAYAELLSQGKNPHEVTRARAVKRVADKERRGIEQRIERKQVDILERLEVERVHQRRRDRLEREKQAFEKKYQAEMGCSAVEARTKAYLLARTGKEQLDPTGKLVRVYPSQETTLKDNSFGLGRNLVHDAAQRRAIVDKVHAKGFHHDAVASALLLPRQTSAASDGDDERSSSRGSATASNSNNNNSSGSDRDAAAPLSGAIMAALSGPTLPIPGRDLRELNHKLAPVSSADVLPPIRTCSASSDGSDLPHVKKGFGKPKRSVLEQRMLANARERQKTNVFQKQVVWGKEFHGAAFLADPPVLWFKDFAVGEPLALTFTLTNVSNTFNHFKLGAMDEDVRELFEIVYDKPGRMSAGISCSLRMAFTALAAVDMETTLPIVAQTGAFEIPVKCTCKKAVPVLLQRSVAFCDVVAGEKKTIAVVLENRGALPLHFEVTRQACSDAMDASQGPEVDDLVLGSDDHGDASSAVATELDASASLEASASATDLHDNDAVKTGGGNASLPNPNDASGEAAGDEAGDEIAIGDACDSTESTAATSAAISESALTSSDGCCTKDAFSDEERAVVDHAESLAVYNPEGSDTPLRHTKCGVVAPYASALIMFSFTPAGPMQLLDQVFDIAFAQENSASSHSRAAAGEANTVALKTLEALPSSLITVAAEATQVPIFVAASALHLGCCVYEKLYRHQLVVCNRGKVALKIHVRVPKALDGVVEFTPNMGYVQASTTTSTGSGSESGVGTFIVQIKFRPQPSMWKCVERKRFGSEALGFLAVPVQVIVPDQVVPVFFVLIARVTPSRLAFSLDTIDFGTCALGHSVAQTLAIENTARLPQHIGALRLPQDVRIDDPSDGVGATLLPHERKTLKLVYQPSTATPLRTKLSLRTSLNQTYSLTCVGACAATPLVLSHSFIQVGATQVGQTHVVSLLCSNISDRPQSFELLPPDGSERFLRITPLVSRVEPSASVRIEIVFAPTAAIFETLSADALAVAEGDDAAAVTEDASSTSNGAPDELQRDQDHDQAPDASDALVVVNPSKTAPVPGLSDLSILTSQDAAAASPLWRLGIPAEERSVHHTWTVLCFRRDESSQSKQSASLSSPLLSLQVATTAVEPKVVATPAALDYKQVAIGQSLVMELTLTNTSNACDVMLSATPLHVLGGFRMINSLRMLRKNGGAHVIKMEFKPQSPIIYEDELELRSSAIGTLRIPLRGEGINPSLSFTPADGWLDFRDTLARNKTALELVLSNASAFPLTYAIVEWPPPSQTLNTTSAASAHGAFTSNGLTPFTFTPSAAMIPAQGSLVVKVVFSPALQRPEHYKQQYRITVPNESEMHLLTLSGRCWEDQLFVYAPALLDLSPQAASAPDKSETADAATTPALVPPLIEDPFDIPPSVNLTSLSTSALVGAGLRKPVPTLELTFDSDSDGQAGSSTHALTHELMLGSTLPPSDDEMHLGHSSVASGKTAAAPAASTGAAAGSFELTLVEDAAHPEYAKLFTLEPMKGALSAGQQVHVHVTYTPHQPAASASGSDHDATDAALREKHKHLVVSQWIEVQALCTLRGGAVWRHVPSHSSGAAPASAPGAKASGSGSSSDADAVRTVQITLRAKMTT